ncbi:SGNH/GDSL hydrolase family protein [Paracoccus sp. (in: a-proteobacteria)]|uniref:SGNH/GDSL hydrolase family protein n=1 Tax=Paracoccus sp. TaxID=267 RepID=UPI002B003937|nr:SGNH/GDSL hydrolase family protein [Paracoccus sp. (in: a-proteobacteria)]
MYTSGTAATATWANAVATEFRIFHYQYGGTLRWRVDGGAWTSVTADTSETLDVITISGLSDAAHTLEIDTTGNAGVVDFVGIYGTRSDAAGVEILKMGNSGTTAFRMQAYNSFVTAPLAELQPDMALVILGTNDYRSTVSPPSVYIAGLQGLVDAARAAVPDMGFIFVVPPQSNPDGQQVPLSDYRDALFGWADAEGHEVISWLDRWPDFATANDRGLWRDNLHPSSLGGRVGAQDTINRLMKG